MTKQNQAQKPKPQQDAPQLNSKLETFAAKLAPAITEFEQEAFKAGYAQCMKDYRIEPAS